MHILPVVRALNIRLQKTEIAQEMHQTKKIQFSLIL